MFPHFPSWADAPIKAIDLGLNIWPISLGSTGGRAATSTGRLPKDDEGINGRHMAVGTDEQGIDVHFRDGLPVQGQPGQGDEGLNDLFPANGRITAEGTEKPGGAEFIEHRFRLMFIQGSHAEDDVPHGLRKDTAQTEHDNGAELGITKHTGDKFPPPLDHG